MGPYTTFDVADLVPDGVVPGEVSLPAASATEDGLDAMMGTLRSVQGSLRADPGVNAFLAVDPEIPLDEMDAPSQSRQFVADLMNRERYGDSPRKTTG